MFLRTAWHCPVFYCIQKNCSSQATVFQCTSFITAAWWQQMAVSVLTLDLSSVLQAKKYFPPGLAFKQNLEGMGFVALPKESLYKHSRTVRTFFPWKFFLKLLLFWFCRAPVVVSPVGGGSCIGLWHMQAVLVRWAWTNESKALLYTQLFLQPWGAHYRHFLLQ